MDQSHKLDILVLAAHPDDAELCCGGTLAKHTALGKQVGIADLTSGELSTRGTPELRQKEAMEAARILGISVRENIDLQDGFFRNDQESQLRVIQVIRKYRPEILLANARRDRHPDHGKGADLAFDASFMAGLVKIKTFDEEGNVQDPWRPKWLYHYIQSDYINPEILVDISDFHEIKMNAIKAFKSQFYDPKSEEPETFISNPQFLKRIEARDIDFGYNLGVQYAEGFTTRRVPGVNTLFDLI